MTLNGWLQILFFLLAVFLVTPLLGGYMARVFTRQRTWLDPVLRPDRAADLPADRRRRDARDALDGIRRRAAALQRRLDAGALRDAAAAGSCCRSTRRDSAGVAPDLAFNTAASFTTNTNWQAYSGESTMSYFTQMAGLAYHNFVSAAVGISVAIAFIRGIAQKEKDTIGNFWVDMVRAHALGAAADLPSSARCSSCRRASCRTSSRTTSVQTVEGAERRPSRRGRSRRRKSSSSSAPTAAASSTPTARIRSRTRRRSRTSSRCSASSPSRPASPTRSAR